MYLRRIRIERLKLIRDLDLDFTAQDGSVRMWTVIIGRNGTGKTSVLQAVALAAAGSLQVNTVAGRSIGHLRDGGPLHIEADFEFIVKQRYSALHPLLKRITTPLPSPLTLRSDVRLSEGTTTIQAGPHYLHQAREGRSAGQGWRRAGWCGARITAEPKALHRFGSTRRTSRQSEPSLSAPHLADASRFTRPPPRA